MENLDNIVEQIFEISSNYQLVEKLYSPILGSWNEYKYAYLIYVDNGEKLYIDGWVSNSLKEVKSWYGFKKALEVFMKKYTPLRFTDVLFFLDMYNRCKCFNIDINCMYHPRFKKNEMADDILKDSYGFLLWHYQLENLCRLFFFKIENVRELYKGLLYKKTECWNSAKKIKLTDSLTLHDILVDRLLLRGKVTTIYPRFGSASRLFNAIKGNL